MRHRRWLSLLVVGAAIGLVAAACSSDGGGDGDAADGEEEVELTTEGGTLQEVLDRGNLECLVNDQLLGFGETDDEGNFVEGQFLKYMLDADAAGLQLTVHAIGDQANHLLLEYLEQLNERNGERDRRFRLVHAQVIAERDFARLGPLGVIAEVQPFHLSDDMRWMEERIGRERCGGAYAFRNILEGGAVLCFGTDWPGTSASEYPIDPMLGLYAAVTRQTRAGKPEEGWFPDQRLSIQEALAAYTLGSAYANFEEEVKGSLSPGKLADVVVLSKNLLEIPPQAYLETEVVLTIVGGRVVFER